MINFTVYSADCVGNSGNCLYPNKNVVTDKESFIKATKMDHVTAKYKGNYRSKDNFESSDCIPLDCDNDHSENPEDWLTPFDIALEIPGVAFAVSYSRHHNLPKGDKSARPRFHIFFPIEIVSDEQEYAYITKQSYQDSCSCRCRKNSFAGHTLKQKVEKPRESTVASMHYRVLSIVANAEIFSEEWHGRPGVHLTTNGDVPAELKRVQRKDAMPMTSVKQRFRMQW